MFIEWKICIIVNILTDWSCRSPEGEGWTAGTEGTQGGGRHLPPRLPAVRRRLWLPAHVCDDVATGGLPRVAGLEQHHSVSVGRGIKRVPESASSTRPTKPEQ